MSDLIERTAVLDLMRTNWADNDGDTAMQLSIDDVRNMPAPTERADAVSRQAMFDGLASIAKAKAKSDAQKSLMGRVMFFTEQLPPVAPKLTECEDCVSREAVLDALHVEGRPTKRFDYVIDVKCDIMALPPVTPKQRWIPVSERLPEDTQPVLLTIRRMSRLYNHEPFITVGHISWNQTTWWCAHDGDCARNEIEVLAWMPLPEPWKGENNADSD